LRARIEFISFNGKKVKFDCFLVCVWNDKNLLKGKIRQFPLNKSIKGPIKMSKCKKALQ
jgi:hypothetical protein